jgi:hypothetical protein
MAYAVGGDFQFRRNQARPLNTGGRVRGIRSSRGRIGAEEQDQENGAQTFQLPRSAFWS